MTLKKKYPVMWKKVRRNIVKSLLISMPEIEIARHKQRAVPTRIDVIANACTNVAIKECEELLSKISVLMV